MQKLMSRMRAAMEKYDMIQDGDRIAVGLSGGKDSVALLAALAEMRRFYPAEFEVVAITVDMRFDNVDSDYSELEAELEKAIFAEGVQAVRYPRDSEKEIPEKFKKAFSELYYRFLFKKPYSLLSLLLYRRAL